MGHCTSSTRVRITADLLGFAGCRLSRYCDAELAVRTQLLNGTAFSTSANGSTAIPAWNFTFARFVGHPAYTTRHLRDDLEKLVFLPDGSDANNISTATTTTLTPDRSGR